MWAWMAHPPPPMKTESRFSIFTPKSQSFRLSLALPRRLIPTSSTTQNARAPGPPDLKPHTAPAASVTAGMWPAEARPRGVVRTPRPQTRSSDLSSPSRLLSGCMRTRPHTRVHRGARPHTPTPDSVQSRNPRVSRSCFRVLCETLANKIAHSVLITLFLQLSIRGKLVFQGLLPAVKEGAVRGPTPCCEHWPAQGRFTRDRAHSPQPAGFHCGAHPDSEAEGVRGRPQAFSFLRPRWKSWSPSQLQGEKSAGS